ncbi:MAG: hypothetical protein H8F28_15830 [Fibrella sp.]|nr:hypothetical protein [Armatimonadota bacterium]
MPYNDFTYPSVLTDFSLGLVEGAIFATEAAPLTLAPEFLQRITASATLAQAISTEKARSEFIIAPILLELRLLTTKPFGLFSGVELRADAKAGLTGICDFLITRQPLQTVVRTPLLALVEAKNDNLRTGLGQCIAEMLAAQIVNQNAPDAADYLNRSIYGVVTTGTLWQFLKLDGQTLTIEPTEHTLTDLTTVLALLRQIVEHG